jgi:hypothetical protein
VRKADSLLILSEGRCAENPMWFKVKLHTYNRVLQFQEDKGNG